MMFNNFIFSNAFIVLFLPLWTAFLLTVNFIFSGLQSKRFTTYMSLLSTFICLIYSICLFVITSTTGIIINENPLEWLQIGNISFHFGFFADNLSALSLFIATTVSFVTQLFSIKYIKYRDSYHKLFIYLNLLNFALAGFFVSTNFIQAFLFSGLTSFILYLFAGFWYGESKVQKTSKIFYMLNSIADLGFLTAIFILLSLASCYTNDISYLSLNYNSLNDIAMQITPYISNPFFNIICLLFLVNIFIKMSQFPIYFSTTIISDKNNFSFFIIPFSYLTGLVLLIRTLPLFNFSNIISDVILYVGLFTILFSTIVISFQNNIKKIVDFIAIYISGFVLVAIGSFAISSALFMFFCASFAIPLLYMISDRIIDIFAGCTNILKMGHLRKFDRFLAFVTFILLLSFSAFFIGFFWPIKQILSNLFYKNFILIYYLVLFSLFVFTFNFAKFYYCIFEQKTDKKIMVKKYNFITKLVYVMLLLLSLTSSVVLKSKFNTIFEVSYNYSLNFKETYMLLIVIVSGICFGFFFYCLNLQKFIPEKIKNTLKKTLYIENIVSSTVKYFYLFVCKIIEIIDKLVRFLYRTIKCCVKFTISMTSKIHEGTIQQNILYSLFGILMTLVFLVYYYYKLRGM